MVIRPHDALTVIGHLQDLLAVNAILKRCANLVIIPGLLIHSHTQDLGHGGGCADHIGVWIVPQRQEMTKLWLGDNVNCPSLESRDVGRYLMTHINVDYLIQVGQWLAVSAILPVRRVRTALEHHPLTRGEFLQDEWAGADWGLDEVAFKGPVVHDLVRVVVQMLRHGDLRRVEEEYNHVVVKLPYVLRPKVRHQAQGGGTYLRIQPLLHSEDNIVRGEVITIVPLDPLAEIEYPGHEVRAGLPAFQQPGTGDIVLIGESQILSYLTRPIGIRHPRVARRVINAP